MKVGFVFFLIAMNALCISAMGQGSEDPFGGSTSNSTSLKGDIYLLSEGTSSLPDFSSLTPVGSIYTKVLDIPTRSFTAGFPDVTDRFEWFAIRYTGKFEISREGEYNFRLVSDDGSRLFIDGEQIIDNDGIHPTQSVSGMVYLSSGQHMIEVDYFQGPREEIALQLFWTPPDGTETISDPQYIPANPSSPSSLYTALYRWFNAQSGDHFYTTDPSGELAPTSGYDYEGITGYIATSQQSGTTALYRWFSAQSGDHFYTTDPSGELAPTSGYDYEGITGYIWMNVQGSATSVPRILNECETYTSEICGTWTLEGDHFNAKWENGATAILKVQNWDANQVVLNRYDSEGASSGLSARYEGKINGNTIEDGSVTWTWQGSTWSGTWNANW
jgi:hypothetical protein